MGLFVKLAEKAVDSLDKALTKGMDAFDDKFYSMVDKFDDVQLAVGEIVINAEGYVNRTTHSVKAINNYRKIGGSNDYIKDEIKCIKQDTKQFTNIVKDNYNVITNEVKDIINDLKTIKDKVRFVTGFFNISDAEALKLMYDSFLIDDRDKAEFYR